MGGGTAVLTISRSLGGFPARSAGPIGVARGGFLEGPLYPKHPLKRNRKCRFRPNLSLCQETGCPCGPVRPNQRGCTRGFLGCSRIGPCSVGWGRPRPGPVGDTPLADAPGGSVMRQRPTCRGRGCSVPVPPASWATRGDATADDRTTGSAPIALLPWPENCSLMS